MKKGDKPTTLDYKWWESHKPKTGVTEDPKFKTRLMFLEVAHSHYKKLDKKSKDAAVLRDRVNQLRQMVAGLKETRVALNNMVKTCTDPDTKLALYVYYDLLRAAEKDRQQWLKDERKIPEQAANLKEIIDGPGLDAVIVI